MQRTWLESYPDGVPADIDPGAYDSLADAFRSSVERYSERIAFSNFGATLSFARLDELSRRFGAHLQMQAGLAKGDRLAIMMPNLLQYPVVLFAALRIGAVVVNVNPLYTPRELEHQLSDCGARAIVVVENFAHVLAAVIEHTAVEHVVVTRMGDLLGAPKSWLLNFAVRYVKRLVPRYQLPTAIPFRRALAATDASACVDASLEGEDLAFLQYTGGTTGVAKGAMLTHRNLVANVEQASAWLRPFLRARAEVVITALPLYHIFALTANCLTFLCVGAHNYLITNPRDMRGFVRELKRVEFTAITGVNTLFNGLLNTRGFAQVDFSALRITLGGGMSVQRPVAERWQAVTGRPLLEAYGLTETSPAVCISPMDSPEFTGSIGLALPSTEVCVRDEAGEMLASDAVGELCVRGPQVMRGYWERPEETAQCLDAQGWFATGDLATIDARGFVRIVDRKKDMVVVSGFNVYPNEVEAVAAAHPGVLEAGVIGVPDARSGEKVRLIVVKRDPALTVESVAAHCRKYLTGYKRPKSIVFADSLPKSNVGKILRRELRERFAGVETQE